MRDDNFSLRWLLFFAAIHLVPGGVFLLGTFDPNLAEQARHFGYGLTALCAAGSSYWLLRAVRLVAARRADGQGILAGDRGRRPPGTPPYKRPT